jgi:hypothetical protein
MNNRIEKLKYSWDREILDAICSYDVHGLGVHELSEVILELVNKINELVDEINQLKEETK